MRFQLPQFIEHEAKIIGPLTFRQFVFIGIAGLICFILYFILKPFYLFLIACLTIMGATLALAFIKFGGRPLHTLLLNFFKFNIAPRLYIWRTKEGPKTILKEAVFKKETKAKSKEDAEEELPLKIAEKSQLKKLSTQIETRTK